MKKMIVKLNGLQIIGSIEEAFLEEYIYSTIPMGVDVMIGDNIDDIIRQIRIKLTLYGDRDIETYDPINFDKCVKAIGTNKNVISN
jgi:hypothetical protein